MVCCVNFLKFTAFIFCLLSLVCIGLSFKPNYQFVQQLEANVTVTPKMAQVAYYSLYTTCGLLAGSAVLSMLLLPCEFFCPMLFISSIFTMVTISITIASISAFIICDYTSQTINVISIVIHFFTSLALLAYTGTVKGIKDSLKVIKGKSITKPVPFKQKSILKDPKVPATGSVTSNVRGNKGKSRSVVVNDSSSSSSPTKQTLDSNNGSISRRPSTPMPVVTALPGSVVNSRPSSPVPGDQNNRNSLEQASLLEQIVVDDGFRIQGSDKSTI